MNKKLEAKDLINVGIFTALYFVIFFACGMLGYFPVLLILLPLYLPIITGIPFMLFLTRVKKFGMVTIMSIILGFLMFATGHTYIPIVTGLICGFLADLVFRAGKYQSLTHSVIGYGVFSIWSMGAMLPMWLMKESYFAHIRASMGNEYVDTVIAMTPDWVFVAIIISAFIAGIVGAFLGRAVLKKHFQRAGIV